MKTLLILAPIALKGLAVLGQSSRQQQQLAFFLVFSAERP